MFLAFLIFDPKPFYKGYSLPWAIAFARWPIFKMVYFSNIWWFFSQNNFNVLPEGFDGFLHIAFPTTFAMFLSIPRYLVHVFGSGFFDPMFL